MTKQPLISFKNVSKIYNNGTVGLKKVNLDIFQGEFVVIVGLSGAGKSTLLRTINKMHNITDGDITINGESITPLKGKKLCKLRSCIGMIFQNFNLVKRSSVLRNVLIGRVGYYPTWKSVLGIFSPEDKKKAATALQRVNLAEKIYARADELSGGQQQRVAIARVFMQNPKIILADEPVASLDPLTTNAIMDDLKNLNREFKMTVIVNLHSVPLALKYADRIIGLRAGELVYDKTITEVSEQDFKTIYQEEGAIR
ncbi:phosphonate ABC transporter ATP-binding protein [Liquorilactobacillus oeni]|nr:phosphonate ABC transporter ATP-binding protein [Liquorilactobacillus oeni]